MFNGERAPEVVDLLPEAAAFVQSRATDLETTMKAVLNDIVLRERVRVEGR